jgi:cytidine deaminase
MNSQQLLQFALEARSYAYAPYSKFQVGAALLADNGKVFTGCNVENASYGLTICAERVAVFKAISEGVNNFSAIAISLPGGAFPCGACRQVLNEFAPKLVIYLGDEFGKLISETTLDVLLPHSFGSSNMTQ